MRKIVLLGSTGSIGTQTLDVVRNNPNELEVIGLAANSRVAEVEAQVREFKPKYVCMFEETAAKELQAKIEDTGIKVLSGMEGLLEIVSVPEADTVLTAVVGMIGIQPTIRAIESGKDIALANKETLVCAGHIIMPLAKEKGVQMLPVDSEHSAIFQSLNGCFNAGAACVSRDFMHHVYFQTPNRLDNADIIHAGPHTHGGNGTSFETKHWPLCCTAALTRILPGFVQWMWMKPRDGGLAAVLYGPSTLETDLGGTAVRIETTTDYPFNETLQMRIEPAQPLRFPLKLRVPEWCANPSIAVNGDAAFSRVASETRPEGRIPTSGDGFAVIDREWRTGDTISIRFPMAPRVETMRDFNDGGKPYCSLSLGPLLFAHGLAEIDENTPQPGQRTDWRLDSSHVLDGATVERDAMPAFWAWPLASPLRLKVNASDGSPLNLVPYGCAKLRISMFPNEAEQ